jgi:hypothetical protein
MEANLLVTLPNEGCTALYVDNIGGKVCGLMFVIIVVLVSHTTRKGAGRASRPPIKPIEVGGPFHQIGVDVLQLPLTENENRYMIVFRGYLTKLVEAFAVTNQNAEAIAKLLVEETR